MEDDGPRLFADPTWATDAPFREIEAAIVAAKARGILAMEIEASEWTSPRFDAIPDVTPIGEAVTCPGTGPFHDRKEPHHTALSQRDDVIVPGKVMLRERAGRQARQRKQPAQPVAEQEAVRARREPADVGT